MLQGSYSYIHSVSQIHKPNEKRHLERPKTVRRSNRQHDVGGRNPAHAENADVIEL